MPYAYLNANLSSHGRQWWSAVRELTDREWLIYYYNRKSYTIYYAYTHLHNIMFINIVYTLRVKHNIIL